jgi:phage major head subunit gpT-like protein
MDKMAVANLVFSRTHSSSDFPILFEGAIDKMLRADYTFIQEFWSQIARQTSVNDFRAKNLYQVESTNGMQETPEGSEIKYTSLVEGKQSIRVKSYAEGIKFTRQAFINDDLDALSIIPSRFVKDWDELRGNLVWSLITDNVTLGDGKALFSSDHKNLATGADSALGADSLAAAMLLFKKQTGLDGKRRIRVIPKFLIVPPELEVTARKLLTVVTPSNTQDVNVFANAFTIIVEPRLTNATAWYLSADPNAIDSLYYAYLQGNETLRVNNEDDFNTDSMKYAVRGDFGTAAIDFRGLVKANGAA